MGDGHNGVDLRSWKEKVMERVDAKIISLKQKITPRMTNPILKRDHVQAYLDNLHKNFVLVPIDKAANNIAIICKKYYVEVILKELGVLDGQGNQTYVSANRDAAEIIDENSEYASRLKFSVDEEHHVLPIMYWIPKMHKTPIAHRFIIASKKCSTKHVSKAVSNSFKLIFSQVENFHKKAKFVSNYNKFWVLQNVDPIITILKKVNKRKRAKSIATYDFSTLYTKIPHNDLIKKLSEIISFVFAGGDKKYIITPEKGNAYWGNKTSKHPCFSQNGLIIAVKHLIQNCFFTVGNFVMRQAIGIPMGIDPAPFWANLYLYTYEKDFISEKTVEDKVRARHFHSCKRFIDDLTAINDGGEFGRSISEIYPDELELKAEHSGNHATFLNLDISIIDGRFIYKLFDKRDEFPFFIVRMPHMDSNIPRSIFYSALVGEFLRIGRSTLLVTDFLPKAADLVKRMIKQGANQKTASRMLKKIIERHGESFSQFKLECDSLLEKVFKYKG